MITEFLRSKITWKPVVAVAETLCRDLPLSGLARLLRRSKLPGRWMSAVRTTRALPVLALHGAALTQVGAATALTKCEAGEYVVTRQWARALLNWLPDVAGFRYRSRHDEDLYALVLFEDIPPSGRLRAHGGLAVEAGHSYALDSAAGLSVVRRVLRNHNDALS